MNVLLYIYFFAVLENHRTLILLDFPNIPLCMHVELNGTVASSTILKKKKKEN